MIMLVWFLNDISIELWNRCFTSRSSWFCNSRISQRSHLVAFFLIQSDLQLVRGDAYQLANFFPSHFLKLLKQVQFSIRGDRYMLDSFCFLLFGAMRILMVSHETTYIYAPPDFLNRFLGLELSYLKWLQF